MSTFITFPKYSFVIHWLGRSENFHIMLNNYFKAKISGGEKKDIYFQLTVPFSSGFQDLLFSLDGKVTKSN